MEALPLVGGELFLDLVNTTGARTSEAPRERLRSYDDLLTWSVRTNILSPDAAERLRVDATAREVEATEALRQMRELREALYILFRAIAEGGEPPARSIARLGAWWHDERSRRELVSEGGGFAFRLLVREGELDPMRWPVIASSVDFLLSERTARLRRCARCDWLFVDESRNGTRIWCKKECGDRERARRHYARSRRRAGESGGSSESI